MIQGQQLYPPKIFTRKLSRKPSSPSSSSGIIYFSKIGSNTNIQEGATKPSQTILELKNKQKHTISISSTPKLVKISSERKLGGFHPRSVIQKYIYPESLEDSGARKLLLSHDGGGLLGSFTNTNYSSNNQLCVSPTVLQPPVLPFDRFDVSWDENQSSSLSEEKIMVPKLQKNSSEASQRDLLIRRSQTPIFTPSKFKLFTKKAIGTELKRFTPSFLHSQTKSQRLTSDKIVQTQGETGQKKEFCGKKNLVHHRRVKSEQYLLTKDKREEELEKIELRKQIIGHIRRQGYSKTPNLRNIPNIDNQITPLKLSIYETLQFHSLRMRQQEYNSRQQQLFNKGSIRSFQIKRSPRNPRSPTLGNGIHHKEQAKRINKGSIGTKLRETKTPYIEQISKTITSSKGLFLPINEEYKEGVCKEDKRNTDRASNGPPSLNSELQKHSLKAFRRVLETEFRGQDVKMKYENIHKIATLLQKRNHN